MCNCSKYTSNTFFHVRCNLTQFTVPITHRTFIVPVVLHCAQDLWLRVRLTEHHHTKIYNCNSTGKGQRREEGMSEITFNYKQIVQEATKFKLLTNNSARFEENK
jgi:hypothetical protein